MNENDIIRAAYEGNIGVGGRGSVQLSTDSYFHFLVTSIKAIDIAEHRDN